MAKFKLEIELDNEAFHDEFGDGDATELARILRKLAERVEYGTPGEGDYGGVKDINGNVVGGWTLDR